MEPVTSSRVPFDLDSYGVTELCLWTLSRLCIGMSHMGGLTASLGASVPHRGSEDDHEGAFRGVPEDVRARPAVLCRCGVNKLAQALALTMCLCHGTADASCASFLPAASLRWQMCCGHDLCGCAVTTGIST